MIADYCLTDHLQEGLDPSLQTTDAAQAIIVLKMQAGYAGLLKIVLDLRDIELKGITESYYVKNCAVDIEIPGKISEIAEPVIQVLLMADRRPAEGPGAGDIS